MALLKPYRSLEFFFFFFLEKRSLELLERDIYRLIWYKARLRSYHWGGGCDNLLQDEKSTIQILVQWCNIQPKNAT